MNRGRPIPSLELTELEREELEAMAHHRRSTQARVKRARVILLCAAGHSNFEVSRRVNVSSHSVGQWRKCFLNGRVKGLAALPNQGPTRRIDDAKVIEVIRLTLGSKPTRATHWSTRALARKIGLSHASVARIWESFGLKPHPREGFQLSTDPFFVERVRDIAGLYMSPTQNALVVSVGKKHGNPVGEHNDQVCLSGPERTEHRDCNDPCQRILSLFAVLAMGTSGVYARRLIQHTPREFLDFLAECEGRIAGRFELHIALDNHVAEKTMEIQQWLARHERWVIHLVPARSSWLHQVERLLGEVTQQCFAGGLLRSMDELCDTMLDYINNRSPGSSPFHWCALSEPNRGKIATIVDYLTADTLETVS